MKNRTTITKRRIRRVKSEDLFEHQDLSFRNQKAIFDEIQDLKEMIKKMRKKK